MNVASTVITAVVNAVVKKKKKKPSSFSYIIFIALDTQIYNKQCFHRSL